MTEQAKRDFIQSLKKLTYFFNHLKTVHKQQDMTLEQLKELEDYMAKVDSIKNRLRDEKNA